MCTALEACGAAGITLKWPNDILHDDAKLGGILVELQSEPRHALAVIGIGLNLSLPTAPMAAKVRASAGRAGPDARRCRNAISCWRNC